MQDGCYPHNALACIFFHESMPRLFSGDIPLLICPPCTPLRPAAPAVDAPFKLRFEGVNTMYLKLSYQAKM